MSRGIHPVARPRLAILSYHSWDTTPEMLVGDIRSLRSRGWTFVSGGEATEFLYGRVAGGARRLVLVTTDDGHPEDVEFRAALRGESCPGVTFINVGRLASERIEWFRKTHADDWSVQDHGPFHRRQFISGHLTGIVHGQKIGGLEHLTLPIGAPLLASAGVLASPRFDPHPEVVGLAAEWARSQRPEVLATEGWMSELSSRLQRARLAYTWRGRTYVAGSLESQADYERRVRRDVREGRRLFTSALGRAPSLFAYPWWQGSAVGDRELAHTGYVATFAGYGSAQPAGMSPYSVPRIVMDPKTARPLDIDAAPERSMREWASLRGRVERAAKRMMGVV